MRKLVGTNWKMNLTSTEAIRYCEVLRPLVQDVLDRDLFVMPPFTAIWAVRKALAGTRIAWGAQDVQPEDHGRHSGDVSAPMLADLGCTYVMAGHSERRRDYGVTDEYVAEQVAAIQRWGMTAIVCVGEPEPATLNGAIACIGPQLEAMAAADPARLVVAYEPVWAIGVGSKAAEPTWIEQVHCAIRERLVTIYGPDASVPIMYGGSVNPSIAATIMARPGVDGLFVGRNALDPHEFALIAHA